MKIVYSLFMLLFTPQLFASEGGYLWLGSLSNSLNISEHVVTFVFVGLILICCALLYRSKLSKVTNVAIPDKGITFRNFVETYGQFIYNQCKTIIGEKNGPAYFPLMAAFFIVIFFSNLIGLIPGFMPPTQHLSTTFALGIFSFIYYNIIGCKEMGVVNYIKHFAGPVWYAAVLIFPLEIISNLFRPFTLALRLRGNMMGDHLVLGVFADIIPGKMPEIYGIITSLIAPIPFYLLGLLVCFIQAFVFTMLSIVYISLVMHHDHGEHSEAH